MFILGLERSLGSIWASGKPYIAILGHNDLLYLFEKKKERNIKKKHKNND